MTGHNHPVGLVEVSMTFLGCCVGAEVEDDGEADNPDFYIVHLHMRGKEPNPEAVDGWEGFDIAVAQHVAVKERNMPDKSEPTPPTMNDYERAGRHMKAASLSRRLDVALSGTALMLKEAEIAIEAARAIVNVLEPVERLLRDEHNAFVARGPGPSSSPTSEGT